MDSTLGVFITGYPYFLKQFRQQDRDILETRFLLRKTMCMRGEEAGRIFYDPQRFYRKGAAPKRLEKTLFGKGGVQGLDDEAHRHRKTLFMKVMTPSSVGRLRGIFEENLERALQEWEQQESIVLFTEMEKALFRAACEWVQVPLAEEEVEARTRQISALIDASGAVGLRHLRGRLARSRAERWIAKLVKRVRDEDLELPPDAIFHTFCFHRNTEGKLLDPHTVAVEVINLIRPTVAVARYITFAALALHEHREYRRRLKKVTDERLHHFVQEVRRYYPFFPFVAAKVKKPFEWQGYSFPKGRKVLLDLYATNHDENTWADPGTFSPERFKDWDRSPFNFVPQGGGEHSENHRCAGEWATIELTKSAVDFLVKRISYQVPPQDLHINMSRIPAIPNSRFKMVQVRRLASAS